MFLKPTIEVRLNFKCNFTHAELWSSPWSQTFTVQCTFLSKCLMEHTLGNAALSHSPKSNPMSCESGIQSATGSVHCRAVRLHSPLWIQDFKFHAGDAQ